MTQRSAAILAAVLSIATTAAADTPRLSFPVDCELGETCFIPNYVDRDPGPGHADFGCGALSYDEHSGTDIALPNQLAMRTGVAVRPVLAGTVSATRDGMPDILPDAPGAPDLTNRSCGNAVIIEHADGWETRYCHLKRGSVAVRSGDDVTPETVIGAVGLSGRTEFPHLHLTLLRDGEEIDPFQPDGQAACGDTADALWADQIDYVPGGIIKTGFFDGIPDYAAIKFGGVHQATLPTDAPAIALWVYLFGGREGDVVTLTINGDRGVFHDRAVQLERTQAQLFRASGRKRRDAPWPAGTYTGTATLTRDGAELDRMTTTLVIE